MKSAPADTAAAEAWDRTMAIAREHALVVDVYGGVATIATPEDQRTAGVRGRVLRAHGMEEAS